MSKLSGREAPRSGGWLHASQNIRSGASSGHTEFHVEQWVKPYTMVFKLFTYGVLTHPKLLESLTGREFVTTLAHLPDYQLYTLRQEGWPPIPAIVPESDASVSGILIHDFDEELSELLDDFEDVDLGLYVRESVLVIDAQGNEHHASTYVAGHVGVDSLGDIWDAEEFMAQHYEDYLNRIIPEFLRRWQ